MRVLLISLVVLFAGCAADPAKVEQVAGEEAVRLTAPSQRLSSFANFQLAPMTFADEIRAEDKKMNEAREFEANLANKIQPLLDGWNAAENSGQGTLVIEPRLAKLRIVSGGARFWVGGLAGDSFLDMDLVLVDEDSGEEISNVRVGRSADAMTGGWSVGKSDQNPDEYVVSIVHTYLENNYQITR